MNKESIVELLRTNDRAVARALVVLNDRQTQDEQQVQGTKYQNGRGFRPCHARMGAAMAQFFTRRGYLTEKQVAYWRKLDRAGNMRIGIYADQLLEEAKAKKAREAAQAGSYAAQAAAQNGIVRKGGEFERAPVEQKVPEGRDPGNDSEELMVLFEMVADLKLQSVRERDAATRDEMIQRIARAEARIAEIKSFYK